MQNWVANTILKRVTGVDEASIIAMTIPQESPVAEFDLYALLIAEVLPIFLLAVFVVPLFRTEYRIVSEKETKVRESMRMMGMKDISYWMSWFTYYTIINILLSLVVFLMLYLSESLQYSDPVILFLVPLLFGESIFGLLLIGQSLFGKAIYASLVMSALYLGSSVVSELVDVPNYSTSTKLLGSLSPPVSMLFTIRTLTTYEASHVGITWDNIWAEYENFSVAHGFVMFTLDFFILVILGLYLDVILPKTYGLRRNLCFCVTPSYWCGGNQRSGKVSQGDRGKGASGTGAYGVVEDIAVFETRNM